MDLKAFLQLLNVSHGPTASGEYMCKCPAHDDRTASLCVNQGEKGIVIKCQAGCTTEAICDSLGIKIRDLFTNVKPMSGGAKQPPKPPPPKPPAAKGQGPGEVVCAYVYRDAQGKPLFEVVRCMMISGEVIEVSECKFAYIAPDGRLMWASQGLGEGAYMTMTERIGVNGKPTGGMKRVSSPQLPIRSTLDEAEHDLAQYV